MTAARRSKLGIACWLIGQWIREQAWALRTIIRSIGREGLSRTALLIDIWTSVKDGAPTGESDLIALDYEGGAHYALFHNFGDDWCWNTPGGLYHCKADGTSTEPKSYQFWSITHWMNKPKDFDEYEAMVEVQP